MMPKLTAARLDIDLAALLANYRTLQTVAPASEIAPVVKADAYGLGMARIAPWLAKHGAQTFFVARLQEGIALRKILSEVVIYVLDGLGAGELTLFAEHDLRPVVNSVEQVDRLDGSKVLAALHIDTGMNRLGIRPEEVQGLPGDFKPVMIISHLACGDELGHPLNAQQLEAFKAIVQRFPGVPASFANSAGAFLGSEYQFDLIRPGNSLYGGGPFGIAHPDIKPVAHLRAPVLQVRDLKAGETVGYGATFTASRDMRLATVGLGYADGLLRSFAASGFATVQEARRPLTGRISMDVFSLDVTGLEVATGDWVEVLGAQQNLDEVATASGTIGYEWLTRLGARLQRHYTT